ncbi:hypothetical protein BH708_09765 [Brachybacterium sp. P6-10-X1]|uniref:glycosyltransferase family 2 protein n=1 Tax=Brachybacterium sp. P6-10-X1 TaxID=1903186 RepID=UPI000971AA90|nr:glycosyltransferase family 2 protein [Brachybacterium sp. P6-10-X1]APX32952.1 hypothetical protein BH708_09765 [Brachybacterium sp. P6-10-X1]
MAHHPGDQPLVSLVIPVYNSMPYLPETLDAIPEQRLGPAELEVILVNDGSDDGSEKVLAEYAERCPDYRVLDQPNSGGPADPCNKGIAAARGKYVFVLGSDDVLTEGALGELAAYAEKEGSDIVLARMVGLNGRHAPGSMFTQSKAVAHLVEDSLFNSLTAIKLFRTDLVRRTGAHNPTHLRVGSDQPFTLTCYLAARKISIRADRAYVLIRTRESGDNVTSDPRTSRDYTALLSATVEVIVDGTEPGELRDGLLRRPVRGALRKSVRSRFLDLSEAEQEAVVTDIQEAIGPYLTEHVWGHLEPMYRLKVRLALAGRTEALRELIRWEADDGEESLVLEDGAFRFDLPTDLVETIGREELRDVKVVGVVALEELVVEAGHLRIGARAQVRRSTTSPDGVLLRIRRRGSEESFDVPAHDVELAREGEPSGSSGAAVRFHADVEVSGLESAVWDVHVVQRYGGQEIQNRLGGRRGPHITSERRLVTDEDGREVGTAYFTRGFGNLSVDIGYVRVTRVGPLAEMLSVLEIAPGRRVALLRVQRPTTLRISTLRGLDQDRPGEEIPTVTLRDGLLAAALPSAIRDPVRRIRVADAHGAVILRLPDAVAFPTVDPPGRSVPDGAATAVADAARAARDLARRAGLRPPRRRAR